MANVTPVLNGEHAPIHGTFVVGPGQSSGLDIDGFKLNFEFLTDGGEPNAETRDEGNRTYSLVISNADNREFSLDLNNFTLDERPLTLHLAFQSIGNKTPHRIVTYTFSADIVETTAVQNRDSLD